MRRRDLLLGAAFVSLRSTPALAQTPERVWRVGLLAPNQFGARNFRQLPPELSHLGFVEGRNLSVQVFSATRSMTAFLLWLSNLSRRSPTSSLRLVQEPSGLLGRRPAPFLS